MSKLDTADVGATLREMWETRPARPRRDRKVAGVAAAVARRYDIDPVLVRVGFAVAAVYGIGIALYVAGWLLLPPAEEDDPLDGGGARPAATAVSPWAWVALAVVLVASGGFFWGDNGGFVLPVVAVLVLLFLLHRSRADRGLPGGRTAPTTAMTESGAAAESGSASVAGNESGSASTAGNESGSASASGSASVAKAPGDTSADPDAPTAHLAVGAVGSPEVHADPLDRGTPPGWDPLGAAPFAWDLPEPAQPAAPEPVRRKSRLTPITLALALLGGGAAGVVVSLTAGLSGLPIVFATALAVLGVGLVVGSFARTGRGLIPFALLLAALTWVSVEARTPLQALSQGGFGDIRVAPTDPAALAPRYERGAGTVDLDLSQLDTSVAPGTDATPIPVAANVGLGEIVVVVPADADLTLRAHADLGDITYATAGQSGTDIRLTVLDDLGTDGVRSGRPIELDLQAGLGSVEVRRG